MRPTKFWLSFLAAVCVCVSLFAQPVVNTTGEKHCLWKVQGKSNTVYLLGSIHVLKSTDYPLAAPIEAAFSNAAVVAFETDIAALDDPTVAAKLMTKAQLPAGETLATQISPETYKLWTAHLAQSGLPAVMFDKFAPGLAAMTVTMLEMQKLGLDSSQGVDKHFFGLARKSGKELVPLETVDFQVDLITGFSKEEGELILKTTLKEVDTMKSELAAMLQAWKTGDGDKLEKLLNQAMKEEPAIYKRLVVDRNKNWLPKIEALARSPKNAVVIVGAAHLVGKDGVVDLLKGRGFTVTQE